MRFVIVAVLLTALAGGVWLMTRGSPSAASDALDPSKMMIATSDESDERAARVLPTKGSEDVSHLLVRPVPAPQPDGGGWGPNEAVEWVIDVTPLHAGLVLKREKILAVFEREWPKAGQRDQRVQIYGHAPALGRWTFVGAAGVPDDYDRVALGVDLSPPWPPTPAQLESLAKLLDEAARGLGPVTTKPRTTAERAAARVLALDALLNEFDDARAGILLAAPEGTAYDGKKVWDVMLCLGLHWGDMDEFHWENVADGPGDNHLFSVSSTWEPGYFLPEQIAGGRASFRNLLFDFRVARTAQPMKVLDGMLAAAQYAQKRLGGVLVGDDEQDLDVAKLRAKVLDLEKRLTDAGFPPGSDAALRLF